MTLLRTISIRTPAAHILRWGAGGLLYGVLEILHHGHTHWTMIFLAALLSIPLDIANNHIPGKCRCCFRLCWEGWSLRVRSWCPDWFSMSGWGFPYGTTPACRETFWGKLRRSIRPCGYSWLARPLYCSTGSTIGPEVEGGLVTAWSECCTVVACHKVHRTG